MSDLIIPDSAVENDSTSSIKLEFVMRIANLLFICLLPIVGFFCSHVAHAQVDHERRIISIEANRFTSHDGQSIQKELARVWQELAKLPREVPAPWFAERVDRLELKIDALETKLDNLR